MAVKVKRSSSRLKDYEAVSMKDTDKDISSITAAAAEEEKTARIVYKNGTFYTVDSVTGEMSDYKTRGAARYEKERIARGGPSASDDYVTSMAEVTRLNREFEEDIEDREHTRLIEKEEGRKARRLTGRRLFESIIAIGLVILAGFFAYLMIYPQTELSELARDNSNLKDEISRTKTKIIDAEEDVNGIIDMDTVKAQALALGMQEPNQNQVVNLPIPNNDSLKTSVSYDSDGINPEALAEAEDYLADYYRNNPGK
ncbi:MAG: hypothetical protein J5657_00050 [Clostridiales bacterium]|nr:hypothetical protein [Clostridiales bacterium]